MEPRVIPSLTPIRGFAALRVMTMHFTAYLLPAFGMAMREASPVFARAYLGVDYFFVLSGFILAHVYGPRFAQGIKGEDLRKFWWARFTRIYPLHLATLGTLVAWQMSTRLLYVRLHGAPPPETFQVDMTFWAMIRNLFLVQAVFEGQVTSWNYPAWSLSAEWVSYLVLPFRLWLYARLPRGFTPVGLILAFVALYAIETLSVGHLDVAGWPGIFRCIVDQFMGVLFHKLYRERFCESVLAKDATTLGLGVLVLALMSQRALPDAAVVPFVGLMVWAVAANRGLIHRVLNGKGMTRLGDLSFGIYLWHGVLHLVLYRIGTFLREEFWRDLPFAAAIAMLAASYLAVLGIARLSLRYFEEPTRAWLRGGGVARIVKVLKGVAQVSDRKV